jgi:hypothetical protein
MTRVIASLLALSAAGFAATVDAVQPGSLTVHEWGTFTSVAGEDGAAIEWNTLGCKSDLPRFVHDFGYRGLKLGVPATVRMETPVLYFYSSRPLDARVKVEFPMGLITEWYPQAEYEVHQKALTEKTSAEPHAPRNVAGCLKCHPALNGTRISLENLTGTLEWNKVRVEPGTKPDLPVESESSRYYAARETDAAPLTVGDQHEKFLFYRGVAGFPVPLSVRVAAGQRILVENVGRVPVPQAILFENREGRMGFHIAGKLERSATLDSPALDAGFVQLRQSLEEALIAQGLYPREAHAMLETWRNSWFEEGERLIYIVPAATVDAILPLEVDPTPSRIARTFVGRIELITPATLRAVESAIRNGNWQVVDRYARFMNPILDRIYKENPGEANELSRLYRSLWDTHGAQSCQ